MVEQGPSSAKSLTIVFAFFSKRKNSLENLDFYIKLAILRDIFLGYRESYVNCNTLRLLNIHWFNLIEYITEVWKKFSCNGISIFLNLSNPDPIFTQTWWDMRGGTSNKRHSKIRLKLPEKTIERNFDPMLNISQLHLTSQEGGQSETL